mmetsp:Transcript_10066/g.38121  ORF Transcript_10066/g.38121 Transcript_10066/m.38121 type:complete len:248 (-) Transcript_10066:95-838(-)
MLPRPTVTVVSASPSRCHDLQPLALKSAVAALALLEGQRRCFRSFDAIYVVRVEAVLRPVLLKNTLCDQPLHRLQSQRVERGPLLLLHLWANGHQAFPYCRQGEAIPSSASSVGGAQVADRVHAHIGIRSVALGFPFLLLIQCRLRGLAWGLRSTRHARSRPWHDQLAPRGRLRPDVDVVVVPKRLHEEKARIGLVLDGEGVRLGVIPADDGLKILRFAMIVHSYAPAFESRAHRPGIGRRPVLRGA